MPLLRIDDINLSFGGVKAINGVSINVEKGSIHAIIGPNGAGKTSIFNCISSVYKPQRGADLLRGPQDHRDEPGPGDPPGHRPHLPEHRPLPPHDRPRQPDAGAPPVHEARDPGGRHLPRAGPGRGDREPEGGRGHHRLPRDREHPEEAGRDAGLRPSKARRAGPGARAQAEAPAARRTDGRDEPRGEGGHGPLHPRHQRGVGRHDPADRARPRSGDGHQPPGERPRFRREDLGRGRRRRWPGDPRVIKAYIGEDDDFLREMEAR